MSTWFEHEDAQDGFTGAVSIEAGFRGTAAGYKCEDRRDRERSPFLLGAWLRTERKRARKKTEAGEFLLLSSVSGHGHFG